MKEYTKKKLVSAAGVVWLRICVGLVIAGHTIGTFGTLSQGLAGLGVELLGLAGILVLLYLYNKPYTK